jgi:hypothetical protein
VIDGREHQLDLLVAAEVTGGAPSDRTVLAIGEAKCGELITPAHLHRLEIARAALGARAARARLLLVGPRFTEDVERQAVGRYDVELVDLERLYGGS